MTAGAKVEVLLATYNGARFLPALLDSLERQEHGHVAVTIRDDGSDDGTLPILDAFGRRTGARLLMVGAAGRRGANGNFFALLDAANCASDYVAFADQDDVWLPAKLGRAVAALARLPADRPALYCGRLAIVDRDLRRHGLTPLPARGPSFANALVENIATGCTMLLNRAALRLLRRGWPEAAIAHDWWCYLVVAAFGRIVYDPEPAILYRQHGENAIGVGASPLARLMGKVRRQLGGGSGDALARQGEAFRRIHGPYLAAAERAMLDAFLDSRGHLVDRLRFASAGLVYRQAALDDWAFRLLYLMGRI